MEFGIKNGDCEISGEPVSEYYGLLEGEIPDTVYRIENGAFSDCSTLVKVNIPESVKETRCSRTV